MGEPTITFDATPESSRKRQFKIKKKVILTDRDPISPRDIDYKKLDFAILECETEGKAGFPAALALESDADKVMRGASHLHPRLPGEAGAGQLLFRRAR